MSENTENNEVEDQDELSSYLLIVDDSSEFKSALKEASRIAYRQGVHVALLYVIEPQPFQQWGSVEAQIKAELRHKAEERMFAAGDVLMSSHGHCPSCYIREGNVQDIVSEVIEEDGHIKGLVLGAGHSHNPLISYFAGKGLHSLKIPLIIIPE